MHGCDAAELAGGVGVGGGGAKVASQGESGVVLARGGCGFVDKARAAGEVGYAAVVVVDRGEGEGAGGLRGGVGIPQLRDKAIRSMNRKPIHHV